MFHFKKRKANDDLRAADWRPNAHHWNVFNLGSEYEFSECSHCGEEFEGEMFQPWCPACGVRMRGVYFVPE